MNKRPFQIERLSLSGAILILSFCGACVSSPAFADKPPQSAGAHRMGPSTIRLSAEKNSPPPVPEPAPFEVLSTESMKSRPVDPLIQEQLQSAKKSMTGSGVTGVHTV